MDMKIQMRRAVMVLLGISAVCVAVSLFSGCTDPEGPQGVPGAQGSPGPQGATGSQGVQGYGAGLTITQLAVGNPNCSNGGVQLVNFQDLTNTGIQVADDPLLGLTYVCNGTNGTNGTNGSNGTNGNNGTNGTSTTFSIVPDSGANCANGGFDLTLTDATQSQTEYVCNGVNGTNGEAGLDGTNGANGGTVTFDLVQAIEPCGAASSPWKEVLLGLQGGQILSDFSETSSGQNTRLSFIPNGTYEDTDESGCVFTVSGDGLTNSQITWSAGSNAYATWPAGGFDWTATTGWVAQ